VETKISLSKFGSRAVIFRPVLRYIRVLKKLIGSLRAFKRVRESFGFIFWMMIKFDGRTQYIDVQL
jgi:hypothetical protein